MKQYFKTREFLEVINVFLKKIKFKKSKWSIFKFKLNKSVLKKTNSSLRNAIHHEKPNKGTDFICNALMMLTVIFVFDLKAAAILLRSRPSKWF